MAGTMFDLKPPRSEIVGESRVVTLAHEAALWLALAVICAASIYTLPHSRVSQ